MYESLINYYTKKGKDPFTFIPWTILLNEGKKVIILDINRTTIMRNS